MPRKRGTRLGRRSGSDNYSFPFQYPKNICYNLDICCSLCSIKLDIKKTVSSRSLTKSSAKTLEIKESHRS